MLLGIPMETLREVVPLNQLTPLPSQSRWLCGGLTLRGVTIPVINLAHWCGLPWTSSSKDCVILVREKGHLLGLLANDVGQLFEVDVASTHPFSDQQTTLHLAAGCVRNPHSGEMVTLLALPKLFASPDLLTVQDPEPQRDAATGDIEPETTAEETHHALLLMNSAGIGLAIHPEHVESTLANPEIKPGEGCGGAYCGNLEYRGEWIPVVELLSHLGIRGHHSHATERQAFVVRGADGPVAFLIDQVMDLVPIQPQQLVALNSGHGRHPRVLTHTWMNTTSQPERRSQQFFILDAMALSSAPELVNIIALMKRVNQEQNRSAHGSGRMSDEVQEDHRLIVFRMQHAHATPIGSIQEVLPYHRSLEIFDREKPLRGWLTHKGRVLDIIDLGHALGMGRQMLDDNSSILVVEHAGRQVGFAVTQLLSIESATWQPSLPVLGEARCQRSHLLGESQTLIEVQLDGQSQLIEMLDLPAIAGQLDQADPLNQRKSEDCALWA